MKTQAEPVNQLDDQQFSMIDRALKRHRYRQDALIEVLHVTQEAFGYIPEDALIYIARKMELPWSWVYGVASFYHSFSFEPRGKHTCTVCMGTACYVRGAAEIVETLRVEIGIEPGQVSADGRLQRPFPPG